MQLGMEKTMKPYHLSGLHEHHCKLHGVNTTQIKDYCLELNRCFEQNKNSTTIQHKKRSPSLTYKDLNLLINAKVEQGLKRRTKNKKVKKVTEENSENVINKFERFRNLELSNSNKGNRKIPAAESESGNKDGDSAESGKK